VTLYVHLGAFGMTADGGVCSQQASLVVGDNERPCVGHDGRRATALAQESAPLSDPRRTVRP
jgi:hypothetical protein